jgi:hypothetical protein
MFSAGGERCGGTPVKNLYRENKRLCRYCLAAIVERTGRYWNITGDAGHGKCEEKNGAATDAVENRNAVSV